MKTRYDEIELFSNYIVTLKETSLDDGSIEESYMTDAGNPVIHFDKVKEAYVRNLNPKPQYEPRSIDALYIGNGEKVSFIEFKNGKMSNSQIYGVYQKIYESLLIFCDMTGENISFCRENAEFILVYNKEKNREAGREKEENHIQTSESRAEIGRILSRKGKKNFVRFGMEKFERLYFRKVFTYTEEEFEREFVHHINS